MHDRVAFLQYTTYRVYMCLLMPFAVRWFIYFYVPPARRVFTNNMYMRMRVLWEVLELRLLLFYCHS